MTNSATALAACACLLVPLSGAAPSAPAQSAPDFIRGLYGHYGRPHDQFDPLGKAAPALFAPALLHLIRADQAAAAGEVGRLDHDPICACQDFGRITVTAVTTHNLPHGRTAARASFTNLGHHETVSFVLTREGGQWRIEDLGQAQMPSLAAFLRP